MILDVVISQILKGRHDLIKNDYIVYFDGVHKQVYKALYQLKLVKEPITIDRLKTQIDHLGLKQDQRNTAMGIVDHCYASSYIAPKDFKSVLDKSYSEKIRFQLYQKINDPHLTPETLRESVQEATRQLQMTGKVSDLASYENLRNKHISDIGDGKQTDMYKFAMKIKEPHLVRVFGQEILPQPQLILGRPNDGKTTLALGLQHDLYNQGYKGLHVTLEDSRHVYMSKMLSVESKMNKKEVMFGRVNKDRIKNFISPDKKNIMILDRSRSSNELVEDVAYVCRTYDIRWVMVDFIQEVMPERYEKEMEAITKAARGLKDICKDFNVACFMISQAPKESVADKGKLLCTGNEYGAAALGNLSRSSWSVNPDPDGDPTKRLVYRYKTSYLPHAKFRVGFDFSTGEVKTSDEIL
jgi:replicative DNA helicase